MSTRIMTRQCIHCRKTYTYNPSVGDMGKICKYCGKLQNESLPGLPKWPKKPY